MATLVLSAAGMALGSSVGGSVLGLSMATVGRAAGAMLGRRIDQSLLGAGAEAIETGQLDRLRLTGASEGAPRTRLYGRIRVAGQVIWASRFQDHTTESGGGKGTAPRPNVTEHSYTISAAIALCDGEITRVGRVWADGVEVSKEALNMRLYTGSDDQMPDPVMEATEGAGNVPAYRGLAYVVLEDLSLGQFGNRFPQLTFEVHRPATPEDRSDLAGLVRGVSVIPGTGEYALATDPVEVTTGFAEERVVNANTSSGKTDFQTAMDDLTEELPACRSASLVVSWFGNDLRCGECRITPKVEQNGADSETMPWTVAGLARGDVEAVPRMDDRSVYGGTPADASVRQAIADMRARGLAVTFYPFILMDQLDGNSLPDPWSGTAGQPAFPWRGRITTSRAPGQDGSPDGTAAARTEVDAFFDGPQGFRAFILHYAQLCKDAGGVDAFCIGSELRSLTQIRDDLGYPAVERLRQLAGEVKAILGPSCKIGYAADWSEYHGHQPDSRSKVFHLDPLWTDPAIDFVGIDNYMPLSDWRDGDDHADAEWGDVSSLDYLKANVAGGELFDWHYPTPEARAAQRREPITDGDGEPWVWRVKDLKGWWENAHHDRIDGVRQATPTAWQPQMKPIWFTELGCAALDRATNQPNKFLDPKSSESRLPYHSRGMRDDYIQLQYLRAMTEHFDDPQNNPTSGVDGQPMVDMSRAHVWSWDTRPWPAFPAQDHIWSDGDNYDKGHWLNGRSSQRSLASVVTEVCARSGVPQIDTSDLRGVVRGYAHADTDTAREALQPLMLAHGFDIVERDGQLRAIMRDGQVKQSLDAETLAVGEDGTARPEFNRASEAEVSGRVRLTYVEAEAAYDARTAEAVLPGDTPGAASGSELPMALTGSEARATAERWLAEARIARDKVRFALPPSQSHLGAGDVVRLADANWRIDRVESNGLRLVEAVKVGKGLYKPMDVKDVALRHPPKPVTASVTALFMDLPLITGDELPHAPHVAATGRPWPGAALMYAAPQDAGYQLAGSFDAPAVVGSTLTDLTTAPSGRWDRGPALRVRLVQGALESISRLQLLAGGNMAAIGDGSPDNWELFQFQTARLVAPREWELSLRLRGQHGSDAIMPDRWAAGSVFVLLNDRLRQLPLSPSQRGISQHYRWGPARKPMGDPTWRHAEHAFDGVGLRPYSPCHLRMEPRQDAHYFSWVRRTRIDGDSWTGPEVPLGETRESYQITLRDGAGGLLRQSEVDRAEFALTESERVGLGIGGAYRIEVAQISDRFGAGPAAALTVG